MRTVISHLSSCTVSHRRAFRSFIDRPNRTYLEYDNIFFAGSHMCYDAGSFGGPSSVMILHSMAPSAQLNYAFRSFKNRPNRTYFVHMQSHVSAGSYMSYDARSFAGPSSGMILHSMAPSAHMNYAACSGTVPPAAAWAFIFRRDAETEGTRK